MTGGENKYFKTAKKMDCALISLLKKKPLEYITVCEICENAGVHRSTFYLHYETIGDLLEETSRYMIDDFLSYFSETTKSFDFNFSGCAIDKLNFICEEYLTPYLEYTKKNKEFFLTAVSNKQSLGFDNVYNRMFENIFDPILERFDYPEANRKYVMMYYLNGIHAINTEWLKDNCQKPISEIITIIKTCVFGLNNVLHISK